MTTPIQYHNLLRQYLQEYNQTPEIFKIKREMLIDKIDLLLQERSKTRTDGIVERCFGDVEFGGRE